MFQLVAQVTQRQVQEQFPRAFSKVTHPEEGGCYYVVSEDENLYLAMGGPGDRWREGVCLWYAERDAWEY